MRVVVRQGFYCSSHELCSFKVGYWVACGIRNVLDWEDQYRRNKSKILSEKIREAKEIYSNGKMEESGYRTIGRGKLS